MHDIEQSDCGTKISTQTTKIWRKSSQIIFLLALETGPRFRRETNTHNERHYLVDYIANFLGVFQGYVHSGVVPNITGIPGCPWKSCGSTVYSSIYAGLNTEGGRRISSIATH